MKPHPLEIVVLIQLPDVQYLLVLVVIPVTWVTGKSIFKDVQKFGEKESKENV